MQSHRILKFTRHDIPLSNTDAKGNESRNVRLETNNQIMITRGMACVKDEVKVRRQPLCSTGKHDSECS